MWRFGLGGFNLTNDETKLRVAKALTAIGMYDYLQRPVQTLIGGQKQRVAIAGTLVEECKVLLLDELTTFFDESLDDRILLLLNMCSNVPLENGSSSTRIAHMKPDILAVAKSFVGTETSDGKQILPRIVLEAIPFGLSEKEGEGEISLILVNMLQIKFQAVLLVAKEVAKHIKQIDCTSRFNVANLPRQYLIILDQLFDISLSLPRPVASSYTTPIESSYTALSLIWDNIVLAYEPVWATRTGKVASPEQAQEVS
ncbi:ABC transporter I family member 10-like protein [Tanacetum coccineum]